MAGNALRLGFAGSATAHSNPLEAMPTFELQQHHSYNSRLTTAFVWLAMAVLMLTTAACDTSQLLNPGHRKRVTLTVTLDGQPVDQARVVFIPQRLHNDQGRLIPLAFGVTDKAGKCKLKTADDSEMLDAVQYRCVVTKPKPALVKPIHLARDAFDWQLRAMWSAQPNEIPDQYNLHSRLAVDLNQESSSSAKIKLPLVSHH